jgi:hypothetical protein
MSNYLIAEHIYRLKIPGKGIEEKSQNNEGL